MTGITSSRRGPSGRMGCSAAREGRRADEQPVLELTDPSWDEFLAARSSNFRGR